MRANSAIEIRYGLNEAEEVYTIGYVVPGIPENQTVTTYN